MPRDLMPILFTIAVLAFVGIFFVYPYTDILLRLSRNRKIADHLVESLTVRFPGVQFHGGASYRDEMVFIWTRTDLGVDQRQEVEQWLRQVKAEQPIRPVIGVQFPDDVAAEREPLLID